MIGTYRYIEPVVSDAWSCCEHPEKNTTGCKATPQRNESEQFSTASRHFQGRSYERNFRAIIATESVALYNTLGIYMHKWEVHRDVDADSMSFRDAQGETPEHDECKPISVLVPALPGSVRQFYISPSGYLKLQKCLSFGNLAALSLELA
jgi:hypothetical protein